MTKQKQASGAGLGSWLPWVVGVRFGSGARSGSRLLHFISSLSTVGLTLGVALVILVVAVMNGFEREMREKILSIVPQVSLYHRQGVDDWRGLITELEQSGVASQVHAMAPFVQLEGLLKRGAKVTPLLIYGVDAELEPGVSQMDRFIPQELLQRLADEPNTVVLGAGIMDKLGAAEGEAVTLVVPKTNANGRAAAVLQVSIIGVLDTGTELDQSLALMGLPAASELLPVAGRVSGIRLRLNDLFAAPRVASDLLDGLPYGYYTSNWTRSQGNLYQAIKTSSSLVWLLLVLIVAIAVFNVVSTLVLSVVEKQRNIAILRTLGASPKDILAIYLVQGSLIGVIGTLLGIVIGLLLTSVAASAVRSIEWLAGAKLLTSEVYPVSYLPIDNRWPDIVIIGVIAMVLSLLAALYPAYRASRLPPAEALRYD